MDWQPAVCSVKERRFSLGRALFEHLPLHHHGGRKASEAGEDFAAARIILNLLPEEHCLQFCISARLAYSFFWNLVQVPNAPRRQAREDDRY